MQNNLTEVMTLSVKGLLCKHEPPEPDVQTQVKKPCVVALTIPAPGRHRQADLGNSLASQSSLWRQLQTSERPCFKQTKEAQLLRILQN